VSIAFRSGRGAVCVWLAGGVSAQPVVVVVGNPQPRSRTRAAAELVAGFVADGGRIETIDLADHGAALLEWGSPVVAELKTTVLGGGRLVIASPTYKAAYTGLLKLFLDQFGHGELGGVPTVPMMTGGSRDHALAVEVHLRPVLVEIGASCPTRGLFLGGPEVDEPGPAVSAWWEDAGPALDRV
jgi:FMN reductase